MSQQEGGILQIPASYDYARNTTSNYRSKSIDPVGFQLWHQNSMYKSSYAHFHSGKSVEPKNSAIPGYGGYIPYVVPQNVYGKGYSPMTKQCFNRDKLAKNILGLATTGFNVKKQAFIDKSKLGSTSKYGKTALQRPHPSWNQQPWKSTTHDIYKNPKSLVNPTYRSTDKWLQTNKTQTKGSGFATNHAYLDGTGWKPHPVLMGDNHRSQYRDRMNVNKDFHRDTFVAKQRKLPKKQMNYHYN